MKTITSDNLNKHNVIMNNPLIQGHSEQICIIIDENDNILHSEQTQYNNE